MKASILLSFPLLFSEALCRSVISLSGSEWTLSNPGLNISVPASFPSQAHLDLYASQVIGNPYYGLNDFNLRWVAWTNWTYTSAPIAGLHTNVTSTWLLFNGLDTFASISFCGQHVASTNNQFRQYHFDVSAILASCSGDPVLEINFGSAPNIADAIADEPGQETWPFGVQNLFEFPNRWFIRKEQVRKLLLYFPYFRYTKLEWLVRFWMGLVRTSISIVEFAPSANCTSYRGPAFAPSGPWQPAWVVQLQPSDVYIRNSLVDIYRQGQLNNLPPDQSQNWVVNASLDYFGDLPVGSTLQYVLTDTQNHTIASGALENVNTTNTTVTGMTNVADGAVQLWWPSKLGGQVLYNITISLVDSHNHTLTSVNKRVGFRTIVLNEGVITQEQLAQGIAPGNNWHFEINGHELYCKVRPFVVPRSSHYSCK